MTARVGGVLRIRARKARLNEYRDAIGGAKDSYIVFKGETKMGIIPASKMEETPNFENIKACRVVSVDKARQEIVVELLLRQVDTKQQSQES